MLCLTPSVVHFLLTTLDKDWQSENYIQFQSPIVLFKYTIQRFLLDQWCVTVPPSLHPAHVLPQMFSHRWNNNTLLGGGVRVRVRWVQRSKKYQKKIKVTTKPLMSILDLSLSLSLSLSLECELEYGVMLLMCCISTLFLRQRCWVALFLTLTAARMGTELCWADGERGHHSARHPEAAGGNTGMKPPMDVLVQSWLTE